MTLRDEIGRGERSPVAIGARCAPNVSGRQCTFCPACGLMSAARSTNHHTLMTRFRTFVGIVIVCVVLLTVYAMFPNNVDASYYREFSDVRDLMKDARVGNLDSLEEFRSIFGGIIFAYGVAEVAIEAKQ